MLRLLLIGFLGYLIYALYKRMIKKAKQSTARPRNVRSSLEPGEMVSCDRCQTFVLRSEAIESGGRYFCSKNCMS